MNERNLCHFYYTARINTRCVDVDKCNMVAFRCPKARIELTLAAIGALLLLVASSSLLIYRVLVLIYPRMAYTGTANIAKVNFSEPLSMLQRVTEDLEYAHLLDTAASAMNPSLQMCHVAAFAVSSYATTGSRTTKPFNPMLGETYECDRVAEPNADKTYGFTKFAVQLNEPEPGVAPTDSRLRPDQRLMEAGQWDAANAKKVEIEEKQRVRRRQAEVEAARVAKEG
ncbi:unnamed protein product, partial [Mesorhabditis spiculigera]